MTLAEQLSAGIEALGLVADQAQQARMLDFVALLQKWNRIHNLTAVRDPAQIVAQHLLDSFSILPALGNCRSLLDVGSGGGFPGIPLAVLEPALAVTLLDSNNKKASFLRQAKTELALANVSVVCDRVESWRVAERFEVIVSRAFADLAEFVGLAGHLLRADGRLLAMKGVHPYEEIDRLPDNFAVQKVLPLRVPGVEAERHLVVITRKMAA